MHLRNIKTCFSEMFFYKFHRFYSESKNREAIGQSLTKFGSIHTKIGEKIYARDTEPDFKILALFSNYSYI